MVDIYKRMQEDMGYLLTELGSTVTRKTVTSTTSAAFGKRTNTYSSAASITANIQRKDTKWMFDEQGNIEGGNALMYCKYDQALNEGDLIVYGGNEYYIKNILQERADGSNIVFKICNLFLYKN